MHNAAFNSLSAEGREPPLEATAEGGAARQRRLAGEAAGAEVCAGAALPANPAAPLPSRRAGGAKEKLAKAGKVAGKACAPSPSMGGAGFPAPSSIPFCSFDLKGTFDICSRRTLYIERQVQKAPPKSLQGEQRRRSQVSVSRAVALSSTPARGLLYAFGSSISTLHCCIL